jgi:hypothetical protein
MSEKMPERPEATETSAARSAEADVMEAIRSLHERIDEVHRLVARRLTAEGVDTDEWLRQRAEAIERTVAPAWRRRTDGEWRWPVTVATAVAIALQVAVPNQLVMVSPAWIVPTVEGALLLAIFSANPHRINRESKILRSLSLLLAALISLSNGWSVALLAAGITDGTLHQGSRLLVTGAVIWLTNVVAFALWYWEFDRGGPVARALSLNSRYPDFQFPQMVSPPVMVPPDWEPAFLDYLYLAFTNASAFSPTDVMPMSRWAKVAMTAQAIISIMTVALVVSRAVNILPSS